MIKQFHKIKNFIRAHEFAAVSALAGLCAAGVLLCYCIRGVADVYARQEDEKLTPADFAQAAEECPVPFQEEDFLMAVSISTGLEPGEMTRQALEQVTGLSISGWENLTGLRDLEYLPNLTSLTVTNCGIWSMDGIQHLTKLTRLDLSGNQIQRPVSIKDLDSLEYVDVSRNQLRTLEWIRGARSLKILRAGDNIITGSPVLRELPQLQEMDLSRNFLLGRPDFYGLPALRILDVSDNRLQSVRWVPEQVEELNISRNPVPDLTPLGRCRNLRSLKMYGFPQADLDFLRDLPEFNSIFLDYHFDRSQVDFLEGRFYDGDKYTKVYLVMKSRGIAYE